MFSSCGPLVKALTKGEKQLTGPVGITQLGLQLRTV